VGLPGWREHLVHRLANNGDVVAFKMGRRQGGPSRTGAKGAYLNRYVTDEQHSRRPIFNATLRAGVSWLFFRVARSTRMTQIWALLSRLEKQPTGRRRRHHYLRDGALEWPECKRRMSQDPPPIVARIIGQLIVIALVVVAVVDLVLAVPRG
jgi:hypothetical protein